VTLFDDLARLDAKRDLTLALFVEGVPFVFVERSVPVSFGSIANHTQIVCIERLEQGDAVLDMEERREVAATLSVDLLDTATLELQALFAANSRRTSWVASDVPVATTTIPLDSTAGLTAGDTIYVGAESIKIGTVASATSLTGCTRGAHDSTAAALTGSDTADGDGDSVYTTPPSWQGRRAFLYGYTATSQQRLGVFVIDESPQHGGDRRWRLQCAGIAQEFFERPLGFGLPVVPVAWGRASSAVTGGRRVETFTCDHLTAFREAVSFPTYVALRSAAGSTGIYEIADHDSGTGILKVYFEQALFGSQRFALDLVVTAQQIGLVTGGGTPYSLLNLMLSREGQAAVSTYDRLPGRLPSSFADPGWSLGAGMVEADVDVAAFTGGTINAPSMTHIIDGEAKLSDAIREFCWLSNCAVVTTSEGVLTLVNLSDSRTGTTSITDSHLMPDSRVEVISDEGTIYPYATVRLGYSPITADYTAEINLVDTDLARRYPRMPNRKTLEFRSIGCLEARRIGSGDPFIHPSNQGLGEQASNLVKLLRGAGGGQASRRIVIDVTLELLALGLGDLVILSGLPEAFSELPDMRGATIEGVTCRIVGRRPNYDEGRITLTLLMLDRLLHVCPAAVIDSLAGLVLTLATTTPEVSGTSPGDDFYVGCFVRIVDVSTGNLFFPTVSAVSSTTVTVAAVPVIGVDGWEIDDDVDYIVLDPYNSADGTTASGYSLIEMATLTDDTGVSTVYASVDNQPRWR
jgi:hypothetical protein